MTFTLPELMALPEMERFGFTEQVIEGQRFRVPFMRAIGAFFATDDTPLMWNDPDGTLWTLGRYADGGWFKRKL